MREYVHRLLEDEYEVETVTNGTEALRAVRANKPDLVLSDVMMPELDGFGLLAALRQDPKTQSVPVVLLSARAGEDARVEGLEAGADDYLVKPFGARELLARVRTNLELAKLRDQFSRQDESQRSAEAIENQWRLFDTALSHTPDFTYIFDPEGRVRYANRALLSMWNRPLEEAIGRNLFELNFPSELAGRLQRQIHEVIETKHSLKDQSPFMDPTGEVRYYEYIFVPVLANDGQVTAVTGSTRDITEAKQAEVTLLTANSQLTKANRELEEFAYVASHDLQEPLRMVSIYSQQLLRRFVPDEPEAREYAGYVREGAQRMQDLIRDLLNFSRAVHADGLPSSGYADLAASLGGALSVLRDRANEVMATIEVDSLPVVKADEGQVAQVFQNLISNSLKYRKTDVPPKIRISAMEEGEMWLIAVTDNGIGFKPEYAERIFGLFKRLHKNEYPGTGIGLAICRRIVERYGGRMWAEGRPGEGATFCFTLQRAELQ
jgi:PAS domain S-box-containing protein